jgi:hypothetical protein
MGRRRPGVARQVAALAVDVAVVAALFVALYCLASLALRGTWP